MQRSRTSARNARRAQFDVLELRRLLSTADSTGTTDTIEKDLSAFNVPAPATVSFTEAGEYLTGAQRGSAVSLARRYLSTRAATLGVAKSVVSNAKVTSSYADADNGLSYVYLQQTYNGLPVLNAVANAAIDKSGRVVTASANFLAKPTKTVSAVPAISAADAIAGAALQLGIDAPSDVTLQKASRGKARASALAAPDLQTDALNASLVYVGSADGTVQLAWHVTIELPDDSHWYDLGISTTSGKLVFAGDYADDFTAAYQVYPLPTEAPNDGSLALVTDPADPTASPYGWHDTNGVVGPEYTITRGNNVYAYPDTNNDGQPDPSSVVGYQIDGGAGLTFAPSPDLTQAPSTLGNRQEALTNLFYLNNEIHDISYKYGFNEAAGNFQTNNYGKGGVGNDAVNAHAQSGAGTNNANFLTPADGSAPRMRMYLFTGTSPQRDGDLDALVVLHEYTHGISSRLTGGPANANALDATQSGGMGEGWSDFVALMLTQKPTDTAGAAYPVGTYVEGQTTSGAGIRRYPYSTNMSVDPETLSLYNVSNEVHNAGEIWASVLWDLNWAMVGKYGATANISDGYGAGDTAASRGGSAFTLKLVLDAMKLQPANPSYLDARNAILQADLNDNGGADTSLIWSTFARRGFGYSAVDTSANATSVTQAFDVPNFNPYVVTSSLNQNVVIAPTTISLTFSEAVVPSSFSIADDVSLSSPSGANIKSLISSFAFTNGNRTLTLGLSAPQVTLGAYVLKIGPNILAADDGSPMNQDADDTPGEPSDAAIVTVNFKNPYLGPDGGGYSVGPALLEAIDLEPGGAGVVNSGLSADDSTVAIPLGTNTFNFYGTSYTGPASLFASSNGNLRVGANTSASDSTNGDLTSSPTTGAIAAFWDDLRTDIDANDNLLYRFDDLDGDGISDRLVIEWSQVYGFESSGHSAGSATFQAILELNTGSRIGNITLEYPDLDFSDPTFDNGVGATVGIKASGTQTTAATARRLLVSQNSATNAYLATGRAVRFGADVVPPAVSAGTFAYQGSAPTVTFNVSEAIKIPSASSFTLVNVGTGARVINGITGVSYNPAANLVTLLLAKNLASAQYAVTINAGYMSDTAGNYNLTLYTPATFKYLVGDTDADGKVDGNDLANLFAGLHGSLTGWTNGDLNYDGAVTQSDLDLLIASLIANG